MRELVEYVEGCCQDSFLSEVLGTKTRLYGKKNTLPPMVDEVRVMIN